MTEQQAIPFRSSHGLLKVDSRSRSWNEITVRYLEKHTRSGKAWADMSSDLSTVIVLLDQRGGYCEARLKLDRPTSRSRYDAGFAVWIPANETLWCYSDNARLVRDVRLTFDVKQLASVLGEDLDYSRLRTPIPVLYDSRVTRCAALLAEACVDPVGDDPLYGEGLTTALLAALWSASGAESPKKRSGGLAPWQLRRTIEYLEADSSQDVSLLTLAELSGLSQSQFARAFRDSTGVPPYQWVLQTRIRRAQKLLDKGSGSIADVAIEVGFADQSHFTKAFKRLTGSTPKHWQRDRKN